MTRSKMALIPSLNSIDAGVGHSVKSDCSNLNPKPASFADDDDDDDDDDEWCGMHSLLEKKPNITANSWHRAVHLEESIEVARRK